MSRAEDKAGALMVHYYVQFLEVHIYRCLSSVSRDMRSVIVSYYPFTGHSIPPVILLSLRKHFELKGFASLTPFSKQKCQARFIKVTHNTCSLHLVSNCQNSSKHTKPSIENSTSLW